MSQCWKALAVRLERRHVVTDSGCWEWTGKHQHGYGQIKMGGKHGTWKSVHVVAYELFVGPRPPGTELDHLCRNRACFNPAHLEPVTHAENMARGAYAKRTHCPKGHEYSDENTYLNGKKRVCRECAREGSRNHKRRKRAEARRRAEGLVPR